VEIAEKVFTVRGERSRSRLNAHLQCY